MIRTIRCDHCNTILFQVKDNAIIILKARHHGEEHVSVVPIEEIIGEKPREATHMETEPRILR